ncbi:MAG TPA: hypothetical protein VGO71_01375 [Baekduia sp.]|jgi:SecD/SecF fusion protein|nr:hypothetical protein [Baekduia sp.]
MRVATRIHYADPLAGVVPEALAPPALPAEWPIAQTFDPSRKSGSRRRVGAFGAVTAVCLVAALLATLLLGSDGGGSAVARTFAVSSPSGHRASTPAIDASVKVLRQRFAALAVRGWSVDSPSPDRIRVSCAGCTEGGSAMVASSVAQPGQLLIYDWEANVLDAHCRPQPADEAVTGGPAAGQPGAGSMTQYQAVLRAARCPARQYSAMAHASPDYYALDPTRGRVLSGPAPSSQAALAAARAATPNDGPLRARIVRVLEGTTVVRAADDQADPRAGIDSQWYVLRDRPALIGRDVTDPQRSVDHATGAPIVTAKFTPAGQRTWQSLTRRIARRGAGQLRPGEPAPTVAQHVAVVLDNRLLTVPFIDFQRNPDGLDARRGVEIAGGFTVAGARTLVALLQSGVLPARLSPTP